MNIHRSKKIENIVCCHILSHQSLATVDGALRDAHTHTRVYMHVYMDPRQPSGQRTHL